MNAILARVPRPTFATFQTFFWLHPEWWSVGFCGLAWLVMLRHVVQLTGHGSHSMAFAQELFYWLAMVAAMMLPFTLDAVRFTAGNSLWMRRHRAIAGFLIGYLAPWLGLGFVVAVLRKMSWTHATATVALLFGVAAVWQRTTMHNRALHACHRRRPLAPVGWQADGDCVRFGVMIGMACVVSCWPMMVACAIAGHALIAMAGGMILGTFERWYFRPRTRAMLVTTLALAAYYFILALRTDVCRSLFWTVR